MPSFVSLWDILAVLLRGNTQDTRFVLQTKATLNHHNFASICDFGGLTLGWCKTWTWLLQLQCKRLESDQSFLSCFYDWKIGQKNVFEHNLCDLI